MPKRLVKHLSSHISSRLASLLMKAAVIQKKIEDEYKAKSPNWLALVRLKKIRLKIAERMYQLGGDVVFQQYPQLVRVHNEHQTRLNKGI